MPQQMSIAQWVIYMALHTALLLPFVVYKISVSGGAATRKDNSSSLAAGGQVALVSGSGVFIYSWRDPHFRRAVDVSPYS